MTDFNNKLDEILDLAGFQIYPAEANKNRAEAKTQLLALINEARVEEVQAVRNATNGFKSMKWSHLHGYINDRIAELKGGDK